jgi:polyhydroxyalkanoate synthase subunit PhaC
MSKRSARPVEEAESLPESLLDRLGVAETVMGRADPVSLGRALASAVLSTARRPRRALPLVARLGTGLAAVGVNACEHLVGGKAPGPYTVDAKDKRFTDVAWQENASFHTLLQAHLALVEFAHDLVAAADVDEPARSKAEYAAKLLCDALAPTNFLATNPAAIRKAFDTGGRSVVAGLRLMAEDVRSNGGWPRQVDASPFKLGENMAATPGRVVYRNELIELIQYDAQTEQVHEIPFLFCPPWINKYYIMDLAPQKSLVEWAVTHGLTVFAISYRNPDSSMRDTGFDDYMLRGPRAAIEAIRSITGAEKVNTLNICLGGTLNTALLAYLQATGDDVVHTSTYLNSLSDFTEAGTLGDVFADERTVDGLAQRMEGKGYLEAKDMARTFDLLRANDLIFRYVADNWLMGNKPPAFDLLAWNNDSTRMPAKMHTFYLRECYVKNALANDEVELAGERLFVSKIPNPVYCVSAIDDHIVPWQGAYRSMMLFPGEKRFVLSTAGHIAGIVNPPGPKVRMWTSDDTPLDAADWLAGATQTHDTWWSDWIVWAQAHSGGLRTPPPVGNRKYPASGAAPGTYVYT